MAIFPLSEKVTSHVCSACHNGHLTVCLPTQLTHNVAPLQMMVASMAAYTDINKAHEVANEVRRIKKQLKEAQTSAQLYNNRERLFGMPVTSVSRKAK